MKGALPESSRVAIVGAGAAGLATAIFARRANPAVSVVLLDGARSPGAKILISGGSRCNVTNTIVTERDFWGGPSPIVRRILRAFPASQAVRFFQELGVHLHEEDGGKLFPDSNSSREVLSALLREAQNRGAQLISDTRVIGLRKDTRCFEVVTSQGPLRANRVVLATGGLSLPKTGSDGVGYDLARALGHSVVPTTPGLVPLKLEDDRRSLHGRLSGVAVPAELSVWVDGSVTNRLTGSLLWTHFGISGPVVLNASRHLLRARLEGRAADLFASFCPGESFESIDAKWLAMCSEHPTQSLQAALASFVPASMAAALLDYLSIEATTSLAHLSRDDRRRVVHALVAWPLRVTGSRGYSSAEVTAGGVPLAEIEPSTMASRRCHGLYLAGEMLDVDGRIGGFNFQWAWSSAFVAGQAVAVADPITRDATC